MSVLRSNEGFHTYKCVSMGAHVRKIEKQDYTSIIPGLSRAPKDTFPW